MADLIEIIDEQNKKRKERSQKIYKILYEAAKRIRVLPDKTYAVEGMKVVAAKRILELIEDLKRHDH